MLSRIVEVMRFDFILQIIAIHRSLSQSLVEQSYDEKYGNEFQ